MSAESTEQTTVAETSPQAADDANRGALGRFFRNLTRVPWDFRDSLFRHGRPTSDRSRSQTVFTNLFLHVMPTRIHRYSLKLKATWGLGVISLVLFLLLTATGVALMIYYKPATDQAYDSMKDIRYVVPTGRFMRNIHRWAAHAMVACVILHMARVFFTSAYKGPRKFNWVVGMLLFVFTLGLSFTGYLLPWDQLAFWAVTIGSEIAQSPREVTDTIGITGWCDIGGLQKQLLLGSNHVGQESLIRFYLLHVMVLPLATTLLIGIHFWRIRKDGGLARPSQEDEPPGGTGSATRATTISSGPGTAAASAPSKTYGLMAVVRGRTPAVDRVMANTIPTYPNAICAVAALTMLTLAVLLAWGYFVDAPLKEMANPAVPENPAKAPWYFLGLQELVSYSAFMGGVGIPGIVVLGLMLVPYLDREKEDVGTWFSGPRGRRVAALSAIFAAVIVVGMLAFTVKWGWLRDWWPGISQIHITLINPGTVMLSIFVIWSLVVMKANNSTRHGAVAMFTCFLVAFVILTYFATVHRGPNWDFYWSTASWPVH